MLDIESDIPSSNHKHEIFPYHPTAYFLHQYPFLFSTTPTFDQPSVPLHDIKVSYESWHDFACREGDFPGAARSTIL